MKIKRSKLEKILTEEIVDLIIEQGSRIGSEDFPHRDPRAYAAFDHLSRQQEIEDIQRDDEEYAAEQYRAAHGPFTHTMSADDTPRDYEGLESFTQAVTPPSVHQMFDRDAGLPSGQQLATDAAIETAFAVVPRPVRTALGRAVPEPVRRRAGDLWDRIRGRGQTPDVPPRPPRVAEFTPGTTPDVPPPSRLESDLQRQLDQYPQSDRAPELQAKLDAIRGARERGIGPDLSVYEPPPSQGVAGQIDMGGAASPHRATAATGRDEIRREIAAIEAAGGTVPPELTAQHNALVDTVSSPHPTSATAPTPDAPAPAPTPDAPAPGRGAAPDVPAEAPMGARAAPSAALPDDVARVVNQEEGEILIRLRGNAIDQVQSYLDALRAAAPGAEQAQARGRIKRWAGALIRHPYYSIGGIGVFNDLATWGLESMNVIDQQQATSGRHQYLFYDPVRREPGYLPRLIRPELSPTADEATVPDVDPPTDSADSYTGDRDRYDGFHTDLTDLEEDRIANAEGSQEPITDRSVAELADNNFVRNEAPRGQGEPRPTNRDLVIYDDNNQPMDLEEHARVSRARLADAYQGSRYGDIIRDNRGHWFILRRGGRSGERVLPGGWSYINNRNLPRTDGSPRGYINWEFSNAAVQRQRENEMERIQENFKTKNGNILLEMIEEELKRMNPLQSMIEQEIDRFFNK